MAPSPTRPRALRVLILIGPNRRRRNEAFLPRNSPELRLPSATLPPRRPGNPRLRPRGRFHHKWRSISSLVLVLDVAADDLGNIGVFFFLLLDERRIVEALVVDLDVLLLGLGSLAGRGLLGSALRFGVGLLEGHEFSVLGLWKFGSFGFSIWGRCRSSSSSAGRRRRIGPRARWHDGDLECRPALRADDRGLAEIVEFCPATSAEALRTELRFCHGSESSKN